MAGGLGFEPRKTESESVVIPFHHPPTDCARRCRDQSRALDIRTRRAFQILSDASSGSSLGAGWRWLLQQPFVHFAAENPAIEALGAELPGRQLLKAAATARTQEPEHRRPLDHFCHCAAQRLDPPGVPGRDISSRVAASPGIRRPPVSRPPAAARTRLSAAPRRARGSALRAEDARS
jgi:hypothetical protein